MEQLIESVRKYPCLWKVDTEDYKNNEIKEAAWRKVVAECGITDVKEAKLMWKKLRDGHRQALNKRKTTTGQAANSDTRPWKYENQMYFLLPHLTNRQRSTSAVVTNDAVTNVTETQDATETAENIEGNSELQASQQNTTNQPSQQTHKTPRANRKTDKITAYLEQEQKRRELRSIDRDLFRRKLLENNLKPKEDTALKKFFDSMYDETNKLSDYLQVKVQRQIFNSVMEARKEQLHNKRPCQDQVFSNEQQYTRHLVPLPCSSLTTDSSVSYSDVYSPNTLPSTLSRPSS
ncbi:uncharacterized protein LOC126744203 [Anthonomus grandis grandis]|uniref:uncharacterized protein LOC126744203 n=1 Tax=Anthonomus grandis grandis TaxID=2921223 RepID=UPI0021669E89|nr:uncharacterized protein LOC126744203 [Anthonomus grandis grandis]